MDIPLTVVGNLTADPELQYTKSGTAAVNFRVAVNHRTYDKQAREWVDGEATFMRCTAWRELAENIAGSLAKGDSIIATGALKGRTYETKNGGRRHVMEMQVKAAGLNLQWNSVEKREGARPDRQEEADGAGAFGGGHDEPPF